MKAVAQGAPADPGLAIEALRAQGAQRFDPVRWHTIEAMARRADAHHGEARRVLDSRLAHLLAAYGQDFGTHGPATTTEPAQVAQHGPLVDLLAHIARHAADPADPVDGTIAGIGSPTAPHHPSALKAVRHYQSTWARLSVDRRLTQALAQVPENGGPLNTQRLLHQALTAMRDASPTYAHRFLSHVEALLWLDQARAAGAASPVVRKDPTRSPRGRKPAGARSG